MEKKLTQQEIKEYNDFIATSFTRQEIQELNERTKAMTDEEINNLTFDDCTLSPTEIREKLNEFRRLKKEKEAADKNINLDDLDFK